MTVTGARCHCPDRYQGDRCDKCAEKFQGDGCQECSLRFQGDECDNCADGYYGDLCSINENVQAVQKIDQTATILLLEKDRDLLIST